MICSSNQIKWVMTLLLIVIVGIASIAAAPGRGSKTPELIKQRLEVVKRANQFIQAAIAAGGMGALDQQVFDWSVRTMEAERDAASDQAGRVAAVQRHVTRMIDMEANWKRLVEAGDANILDLAKAQWNRLEGEGWLAEENAKKE